MSNYVDISTVEGLQEEEELIEAVEAIVEIAAVSVKSGILNEWNTLLDQIKSWIVFVFPIMLEYQKNPYLFWQDLQHLSIFLVLYGLAFVVLAPWQNCKRKVTTRLPSGLTPTKRRKSFAGALNRLRNDFCNTTTTTNYNPETCDYETEGSLNTAKARYLLMEEETDEERFARVYPSLQAESKYANLILPPVCRLIEKPIALELRNQHEKQEKALKKRNQKLDAADDPVERFHFYFRQFLLLGKSLFTYDYAGAAWTIFVWMQRIIQHRRNRKNNQRNVVDNRIDTTHNTSDLAANSRDDEPEGGQDDDDGKNDASTQNVPSISITTPFVTPMTEIVNRTAEVGPQTPRIPFLDRHTRPCLSPLPEENKVSPQNSSRILISARSYTLPKKKLVQEEMSLWEDSNWEDLPPANYGAVDSGSSLEKVADGGESDTNQPEQSSLINNTELPGPLSEKKGNAADNARNGSKNGWNGGADSLGPIKAINDRETQVPADNGDGDESDTVPETPRSPLSDEAASPITDVEARLRAAKWYFFETAHSKESLKKMSLEVPVPDKNGYVLGDEYLPNDRCTPLLAFVNSRSGVRQGPFLITQLRRLLNPIQIWDLADGGPEAVLESFCALSKFRILVCGGDGTVSWIISALDSLKLTRKWPPIAILPLGTGNDLARVHGWGAGYNNESILTILEQVSESYISVLDRWDLTVEEHKKKRITTKMFLNYFSIGVDAEAALQVHNLRNRRPEWFFSRLFNKAWYGLLGAEQHIKGNGVDIPREIELYADGVQIPLPVDSQGIIIMNIDCYAGGVPLWSFGVKGRGTKRQQTPIIRRSNSMGGMGNPNVLPLTRLGGRVDSSDDLYGMVLTEEELFEKITACDSPGSCQDGYLEIVSVRGFAHLGQCTLGLGNAERVGQCRELKIVLKSKVAVQIDGEPWRQDKCVLRIKRKPDPALMLHRSVDDGGIETEMSKLLEWAEERKLIDAQVHSVLMKEFSRRIESKTRERRVRTMEHSVVQHLKRAIGSTGAISSLSSEEKKIRPSRSMHTMRSNSALAF